ncbi:GIY-YIG nuclease family protein [Bradyrhizobium sp. Tv2a-2]|uniref:GIY-YIG nuclease family protein n=1 Tax=Bradyrhizobium sp. Tv2a-2 TaxID=113395 RepID=UPI00040D3F1A|nr:GIY-YIG nuclease family protein [Bradyrhizobium sp. Tv2a-2]
MRFFFSGPRIAGLRPGISFGPEDFRKLSSSSQVSSSGQMTGGFVYVLADESGRHKIGSAIDPIARRAQLQTGSAEQLSFAFVGVAPEMTYVRIERAAHALLEQQKIPNGGDEWFRVPASIAIGAVYEAAQRLGFPIQQVAPEMVPHILLLARQPDPAADVGARKARRRWGILAGLPWYLRYPAAAVAYSVIGVVVFSVVLVIAFIAKGGS